ncbi:MAG: hypothetical protein EHM48_05605 [Planctomycetaceae bacterium]|nr:MAG: hypothetical protein EHM48_05605 [Planctomycetaceae bacterium]
MTDESFWPARNVAEYAYCPRLFYMMEVEGIFVPNADTAKGITVHRRVDRPSEMNPESSDAPADPDRPAKVRSLTLSSPNLGLTATLDLAEIAGNSAVPVEYRKGKPKRPYPDRTQTGSTSDNAPEVCIPEPWPTDRVQVALQSLLLEEAGPSLPTGKDVGWLVSANKAGLIN